MFKKASAVAEQADQRASGAATETETAAKDVQYAEQVLEQASQELQRIESRSDSE